MASGGMRRPRTTSSLIADHIIIDHRHPAAGDGVRRQFLPARHTQLADDEDIKPGTKSGGHLVCHRHPAAGKPHYNDVIAIRYSSRRPARARSASLRSRNRRCGATSSIRLIPHGWGDIHPRNLGLRMRTIRRAARSPVSDQQEHLVIRIRPRMRRLGQERRRPGHGGGYSLSHRDQHVRGQGNQQRRQALGVAPVPRQRHQPEQVIRSAGILPGNRRSSPLARLRGP